MVKRTQGSRIKVEMRGVVLLLALILAGCAQAGSGGGGNADPESTQPDFANPFPVASVTDGVGGFNELAGAFGITTVTIGPSLYALVASVDDDGVQIIGF